MQTSDIAIVPPSSDYELLDSGDGEKLERFGQVVLARPDPQALWPSVFRPRNGRKPKPISLAKADGTD